MHATDQQPKKEISDMTELPIVHKMIALVDQHSDFDDEVIACLSSETGYLYKSPTCFVIANYDENTRDLLVHFVVGDLIELLELIPFEPLTISFEKNKKVKTYDYERFILKCGIQA